MYLVVIKMIKQLLTEAKILKKINSIQHTDKTAILRTAKAAVHGLERVRHDLATKPRPPWLQSISDKLHTLSTAPPSYLSSSFPQHRFV